MKRILIVKLWALGDVLLATPLLRALKGQWPDCKITWLVEAAQSEILRGNPLVDEVFAFDSAAWRRDFRYVRAASYLRTSLRLRRELNARHFDAVLNLTGEKWWSVWFNAAPIRIGLFPRPRVGGMGRLYTNTIARPQGDARHNSRHYLRAAEVLGISGPFDERMVVGVLPEDRAAARDWLQAQPGFDASQGILLLHPGTSQESKCWLPEHHAAVAEALGRTHNVVVTGSPKERALGEAIRAALSPAARPPLIAAGSLANLGQTTALVAEAVAVVTGDTSILHIASALGTPFVAIYGSTRPRDNAPRFGRHLLLFDDSVPCAPCYKAHCPLTGDDHLRCQRAVTPTQVLAALDELLSVESAGSWPGVQPRPTVTNPAEAAG